MPPMCARFFCVKQWIESRYPAGTSWAPASTAKLYDGICPPCVALPITILEMRLRGGGILPLACLPVSGTFASELSSQISCRRLAPLHENMRRAKLSIGMEAGVQSLPFSIVKRNSAFKGGLLLCGA